MDLMNGNIRVSELLKNPGAMAILRRYVPSVANDPSMLSMASSMTLNQALSYIRNMVSPQLVNSVLEELKAL